MPKISSSGSKSLLFSFIIRVIIFSGIFILLLSLLFSFIVYKLDLDDNLLSYFSLVVTSLSAFFISYFSVKPFKNNGFAVGIISISPLIIYSFVNTIVFKNGFVIFLIKVLMMLVLSAFAGNYSIKRKKKYRVK